MPVRFFRSAEEMNQPRWREPGDPALYRAIESLWNTGRVSFRRKLPPGVYRYRSIEEMNTATERWMREALERSQAERHGANSLAGLLQQPYAQRVGIRDLNEAIAADPAKDEERIRRRR